MEVIVVGAGPTGMMLGAELRLAGVDVLVLERRASVELVGSRAGGFHSRTIELLDQRGVADRFLAAGTAVQTAGFAGALLDISDFPTRHPYGLALWQNDIERILAEWIDELGVRVRRGVDVVGFAQDDAGVVVELAGGERLRAAYLVGADGGRSAIRQGAGFDFPGWEATCSNLIAEVEVSEEIPKGVRHDEAGVHGLHLMEDGRTVRVVVTEAEVGRSAEPTLDELKSTLARVFGTDFGVHDPTWISRFTDATRQAAAYRSGCVLLAGDAAHIHYPAGGQGIGLGVQDAMNLGWKLAQVVTGVSPESLLDSYHDERQPATGRVLRHTMAAGALQRHDARTKAIVDTVGPLMAMDEPRKAIAGLVHGLDVAYDLGAGHPLLGRRMPDLDLETVDGPLRVFTLLHRGRPALINLGESAALDISAWSERVPCVDARFSGSWELPVIGEVESPSAVLIRPDGYVAWVGRGTDEGLVAALARWFGELGKRDQAQRPSSRTSWTA